MRFYLVALLTFSASLASHIPGGRYFVVWNTGQGQWLSDIDGASCKHFDIGGEHFPWSKILRQCGLKFNHVYLSHWDWDHIGALSKSQSQQLKNACIVERPLGKASQRKMKIIDRLRLCPAVETAKEVLSWSPSSFKTSNEGSRVYRLGDFLIPGDSSQKQEKIWSHLPWVHSARVLILGHHGSKDSTSALLLANLSQLKMAVSSARWQRYRHPHSSTEARLKFSGVSLIRTEDWGNIWFEK